MTRHDPQPPARLPPAQTHCATQRWTADGQYTPAGRTVPEEIATALTYNGTTHAVMMATPEDLEDFATGFSLTERLVRAPREIRSIEVEAVAAGIDLRIWLDETAAAGFHDRRRRIAGPTGCGLCGIDSLAEADPDLPRIEDGTAFAAASVGMAQDALFARQVLHGKTRAVHAAGLWRPDAGLVAAREDVGRHNALDKLVGACARLGQTGAGGLLLLTSRVSVEMVQKAAVLGAPVIVAVSAPTALAVRRAERSGITLAALARGGAFEVFTHPERITP